MRPWKFRLAVDRHRSFGARQPWWAPKQVENCHFVVKRTKVFSYDGVSHAGLFIGDAVDWDVPSDTDPENSSGCDSASNLIY